MYSFETRTAADKLTEFLSQYEAFKGDNSSSSAKAIELSTNSWHLTDWVFEEFKAIHQQTTIGVFRETLYPLCPSLKIMHDIANGSKHSKVSRPKATIKETRKYDGEFSQEFSSEHNISALVIEMENGSVLYFMAEIKAVISFWTDYFENELGIKV